MAEVLAINYDPVKENVLEYQRVMEEIMEEKTVIPMTFGTTFSGQRDVQFLLEESYGAFMEVLKEIEGTIELGVKVLA